RMWSFAAVPGVTFTSAGKAMIGVTTSGAAGRSRGRRPAFLSMVPGGGGPPDPLFDSARWGAGDAGGETPRSRPHPWSHAKPDFSPAPRGFAPAGGLGFCAATTRVVGGDSFGLATTCRPAGTSCFGLGESTGARGVPSGTGGGGRIAGAFGLVATI